MLLQILHMLIKLDIIVHIYNVSIKNNKSFKTISRQFNEFAMKLDKKTILLLSIVPVAKTNPQKP